MKALITGLFIGLILLFIIGDFTKTPDTPAQIEPTVNILDFSYKRSIIYESTRRADLRMVTYSYRAQIENPHDRDIFFRASINLLDTEGFIIQSTADERHAIDRNSKKTIKGTLSVNEPIDVVAGAEVVLKNIRFN